MLVSAHDGGVDHHVFVVVIARQLFENALENPALIRSARPSPPAEPLVDDFPITETLRKVAPRNASSVPEKNGLHKQPIVGRRAAHMSFSAGQKILDPIPLVIA